jgi:hypothetical protein
MSNVTWPFAAELRLTGKRTAISGKRTASQLS